jgi:hypothetical protein
MKRIIGTIALIASALVFQQAKACTISEDMYESVPVNYHGIPNSSRLKIADMVSNAKRWPDVEIQAQIVANAYAGEKNATALAKARGDQLRDFLIQLGLKSQYIYVENHIVQAPYPADSTGPGGYMQLGVSLMPLCNGGCDRLCNDPHVTPNSKAIK